LEKQKKPVRKTHASQPAANPTSYLATSVSTPDLNSTITQSSNTHKFSTYFRTMLSSYFKIKKDWAFKNSSISEETVRFSSRSELWPSGSAFETVIAVSR
jgi:hypothetical protein